VNVKEIGGNNFLQETEVRKMAWNNVREKKAEVKRTPTGKVIDLHPSATGSSSDAADEAKARGSKDRDLAGGMEMLDLNFLLSIVESTKGDDKNDVTMRRLAFNELLRREKQDQIDSTALTVYSVNRGDLYGKVIQCEAMKELTKRTLQKSKHGI